VKAGRCFKAPTLGNNRVRMDLGIPGIPHGILGGPIYFRASFFCNVTRVVIQFLALDGSSFGK